ncbi:PREDICTED: uncharacterized protein LOC108613789 [Drosophila arizonae]|uniref:Uncharacterized protein LOC108613789 n=1 Tax=Drosophila arizonae TaxID=7263 RepID=A0ABM1P713_DROAR|nr:PREDICTED: uncharacterized protein LOC108613789 [Drosophila arizonae]
MVDPNRKINRLSDKDISFLEECEEEFGARYTEDDVEFMAHCAKPVPDPPVIENWLCGRSSPGLGGGPFFSLYNYNGEQRRGGGARGWQRRGYNNHNSHNSNKDRRDHRRNRYESYPRRDRGDGDGGNRSSERNYQHRSRNEPQQGGSPMQVRRDYGNFVPASKD